MQVVSHGQISLSNLDHAKQVSILILETILKNEEQTMAKLQL